MADEDQKAVKLNSYIKDLQSSQGQKDLVQDWKILERMYGVKHNVAQPAELFTDNSSINRIKLNVVKSVIDTIFNKVGKNKPLPYFLTSGGTHSQKQKSKNLSKFIDGMFYETEAYRLGKLVLRDALLRGTGVIKPYIENNQIKIERLKASEVLVDMDEANFIEPTQYHQIARFTREELKQMYPKFKEEIDMADAADLSDTDPGEEGGLENCKDPNIIEVIETWVLEQKMGDEVLIEGKHVIGLSNVILHEEPYHKTYPPFIFFKWDHPLMGFWGTGIAENIQSLQVEINKTLRTLQLSLHLTSIPKIFLQRGTTVPRAHLNNKIGGLIVYDGQKPSYESTGAVPPELLGHLEWLINQVYQMSGVSVLSAQSLKPSGLDSGKALNTMNDIESERFLLYGQKYEELFIDLAYRFIDMAKDLSEKGIEVTAKAHGDKSFETMKWSEVAMKDDEFIMKAYPISFFSTTPAAKFQEVQEMINVGMIDRVTAMKLLDFPDLGAVRAEVLGVDSILDKYIDKFLKGEYVSPSPYLDLQRAQTKIQNAMLEYEADGLEEPKLDLFRRFIDEIAVIKNMQAQQVQQEQLMMQEQAQQEAITGTPEQAEETNIIDEGDL